MKSIFASFALAASAFTLSAQEKTNHLLEFLSVNKAVEAEFVQVEADPSMEQYGVMIEKIRNEDPEWFSEHEKTGTPGSPIPFHEKLMKKEDYDAYLKAWDLRKLVPAKGKNGKAIRVKILLTKEDNGKYVINIPDVPISVLEYSPETNSFSSTLGEVKFLEEVKASADNSLRAWSGYEWNGEKKSTFDTTKQNFAIGRTANGKYGYIIYRIQQLAGTNILDDKRYVLRFAPVKKAKK